MRCKILIAIALLVVSVSSFAQDSCDSGAKNCAEEQFEFSQFVSSNIESVKDWYSGLSEGQKTQIFQVGGIALILTVAIVFGLVATRKVVFYYDLKDAFWAMSIFIIPMIGALIAGWLTPENPSPEEKVIPNYVGWATLFSVVIACLVSIWNAVKYNSNIFVGLITGLLKVVMGLGMLLTIFGIFSSATDSSRFVRERAFAVAVLSLIFGLLWRFLVNGEQVEERRQLKALEATI